MEKIYRDKDGKLVLRAHTSVGMDNAVEVNYNSSYPPHTWPENTPAKTKSNSIWGSFVSQESRETAERLMADEELSKAISINLADMEGEVEEFDHEGAAKAFQYFVTKMYGKDSE